MGGAPAGVCAGAAAGVGSAVLGPGATLAPLANGLKRSTSSAEAFFGSVGAVGVALTSGDAEGVEAEAGVGVSAGAAALFRSLIFKSFNK